MARNVMGQVFRRTYKATDGSRKTCATWTIRYYRNGRPYEESTKFTRKTEAQNLLKRRMGDIVKGVPVNPAHLKLTFDDAATDVINDFKANAKRSLTVVERRITKHLLPFFRGRRMSELSAMDVRAFIAKRQADTIAVRQDVTKPVSNAEINRELQILKRAFSLAIQSGKVHSRPHIAMLRESAPRAGFFERSQFESVQAHLPEALRGLVEFAYITGWRVPSEVQPLEWRQVDFGAGTVRLDPGQTKNGDGRLFPMTVELRALLEAQRAYTDAVQRENGAVVPYVFHRNGKAITAFTKAWRAACAAAGCPGRIPHDLRRTAVRNLVRAGVPERVSMQMTGHKTPSVFARYNIVNEADLFDAARRYEQVNRDSSVTVEPHSARLAGQSMRIS